MSDEKAPFGLRVGDRVRFKASHPHAGRTGRVDALHQLPLLGGDGVYPRVAFDDDERGGCYATRAHQFEVMP